MDPTLPTTSSKVSTTAPMIVSLIVLAFFAALIGIATYYQDHNTLNGYGEVVKNLVIMVVSFWIGSSVGSARKDATIAASVPAVAPAPVVAPPAQ